MSKNSVANEVTTRQAAVDNGHFTIGYSVQNVPGWNVWLTLENAQLIRSDSPNLDDHSPVVVSRYQARLLGNGRARIPLEFLPTTDEGLSRMRASIGPAENDLAILRPSVNVSRLAYQTESLMRVSAILMMLPEGQTPDSLLDNKETESSASPRYKTIGPRIQPNLGPFEGTYEQGRVELFALSDHPPNGQLHWKPNGDPLTESVPELGGSSTAKLAVTAIAGDVDNRHGDRLCNPVFSIERVSRVHSLPTAYWPLLTISLLCYIVLTHVVKMWRLKKAWI